MHRRSTATKLIPVHDGVSAPRNNGSRTHLRSMHAQMAATAPFRARRGQLLPMMMKMVMMMMMLMIMMIILDDDDYYDDGRRRRRQLLTLERL